MGPLKKQPRLLSHFLKPDVNFCPQFLFLFLNLSLVESIGVECMAMDWLYTVCSLRAHISFLKNSRLHSLIICQLTHMAAHTVSFFFLWYGFSCIVGSNCTKLNC